MSQLNAASHSRDCLLSPQGRSPGSLASLGQLPGRFAFQQLPSPRATVISRAVTCAPLHKCHVVEIGVPSQSRLHYVFGEMQLLEVTKDRTVSCGRLLSGCPALRVEQQELKGDVGLQFPGQPVTPPTRTV